MWGAALCVLMALTFSYDVARSQEKQAEMYESHT
jgi:hypothetical protein